MRSIFALIFASDQHILLAAFFTVLTVTGIPRSTPMRVASGAIGLMGGIELTRQITTSPRFC